MKYFVLILFLILGYSCQDKIDINDMKISESTINEISNQFGEPYQLFSIINRIYSSSNNLNIDTVKNGLYFERVSEEKAINLYDKYKSVLEGEGNLIFLSNQAFAYDGDAIYDLVILKAVNQFMAIHLLNTHGRRIGISHEKIVNTLMDLDKNNPMDIYCIDEYQLRLKFRNNLSNDEKQRLANISPDLSYQNQDVILVWPR